MKDHRDEIVRLVVTCI